jgi:hypothetical protein
MLRMKILKSCILVVATITVASGFMGCNKTSEKLAQVTITPANQIMAKSTTQQLTANGTFSNGMILNWTQVVSWSSSDTTVATVNNTAGLNGIVTSSTNTGTTIITVFDVANNITGTTLLTVADPDSLQIIPTNPYMPINAAFQFSAIALFSGGTVTQIVTNFATWSALTPGLVTIVNTSGILGNGMVTAGTVTGATIIQAIEPISGHTGTTTVTITSTPFAAVVIDQVNPIISMSTTTLQQFTAIGTYLDGSTTKTLNPTMDASWNWISSNIGVATIDFYTGLATAVTPGATTITAKDPITGIGGTTTLTIQ